MDPPSRGIHHHFHQHYWKHALSTRGHALQAPHRIKHAFADAKYGTHCEEGGNPLRLKRFWAALSATDK